jgi:hypothetical protein
MELEVVAGIVEVRPAYEADRRLYRVEPVATPMRNDDGHELLAGELEQICLPGG